MSKKVGFANCADALSGMRLDGCDGDGAPVKDNVGAIQYDRIAGGLDNRLDVAANVCG